MTMLNYLQRARIGSRLIALALTPLFVLSYFAGAAVLEQAEKHREGERLVDLVHLASSTSAVVHALQRERGATSLFVSSGGKRFADKLPGYRADVDEALQALREDLDSHRAELPAQVLDSADDGLARMRRLDTQRRSADVFAAAPGDLISYYTGAITDLLASLNPVVKATTDPEQARHLAGLLAMLNAKEKAGIERAQLSNAFSTDQFAPGQLVTVSSLVAAQGAYLGSFLALVDEQGRQEYEEASGQPAFVQVSEMEAAALSRPGGFGVDAVVWFDTATAKIDMLKSVEDAFVGRILDRADQLRDEARSGLVLAAALAAGALALTLGLAGAIIASITRPLRRTAAVLDRLAEGHLDQVLDVPEQHRDEIAQMGRALGHALANMRVTVQHIGATSETLASAATELDLVCASLQDSANASAGQASSVSSSVETVAASVQTVAGATDQMAASIRDIARNAAEAAGVASAAAGLAARANDTVTRLGASSSQIQEVVKTVAGIAEQTNLLALNATIEAARAGEAGKGFAVVAGEVKDLARETALATDDIARRVQDLHADTDVAVTAIAEIAEVVARIDASQAMIAAGVEEQTAATSAITQHAVDAATGTERIASGAAAVAEGASHETRAVADLRSAAGDLSRMATELRTLVHGFRY
jgi:methyl-accepting chemotaxis protein